MTEYLIDSDGEINENEHSKLLASVTQLEGKHRVKPSTRKEPSLEISEFHLVKSNATNQDAVRIHELAQVLEKHASHGQISQKIKATKRTAKTLLKPLDKPEANRIDRTVRYENVKHQLNRWDAVVHSNRLSNKRSFPLNQPRVRLESSTEFLKKFKPQTPLEIKISEILAEGKPASADKEEDESEFPLTLQEMVERREELMQLRAKQWSRETKAARQKKIKSKKYHRILRKEKIKEQLKEFEALKKTDPEAALERLEQLDKTRAEERASLRHRSTGHWARNRAVRAKYDKDSRQVLAQQLSISRELTQKVRKEGSSDDEEDNDIPQETLKSSDNPWVDNGLTASADVSDFVSGYQQYLQTRNKKTKKESKCLVDDGVEEGTKIVESDCSDLMMSGSVENIESDCNAIFSQQTETVQLSEDDAFSNAGSRRQSFCDNSKVKSKNNAGFHVESNHTVKSKQRSSRKSNSSQNNKNENEAKTIHVLKEKSGMKRRKSEKCNNMKQKQKIESKVVATTTGWTVVSTEKNSKKLSPKKREGLMKKRLSSLSVDELFDDIGTKFKTKLNKQINKLKHKMHIGDENDVAPVKQHTTDFESTLAFKKTASRPVIDEELDEGTDYVPLATKTVAKSVASITVGNQPLDNNTNSEPNEKKAVPDIDPNKFLTIKPKHLKSQLPDISTAGEDMLDDETEEHIIITEAFAEDDVVVDFWKEKEETVNASKEKEIDLNLPGWGQWGGKNLPTVSRKKRRVITKKPAEPPRKDSNKGGVIISEKKDEKIKEHLVNALPFPFTSVKSFEASIRAPIGNTWVPETSFWQLTNPEVETKLGAIIEPMDESELVNVKNKSRKTLMGKW